MRFHRFAIVAVFLGGILFFLNADRAADPAPRQIARGAFCHYKSPAPGMTFTAGIPLRVLVDGIDPQGYLGKTKKSEAAEVRVLLDGKLQATTEPAPDGYDYFEATLQNLTPGAHVLTAESVNYGGGIAESTPVPINVVAPAPHAKTIKFSEDQILTGSTNLEWNDLRVEGNGFHLKADANWKGNISIHNSFITGLGNYKSLGIDLKTTGTVDVQKNIFEGTGASHFTNDGSGDATINDNEFRSNNLIQFVSSNPEKSPIIRLSGNSTGTKVFQGNRIGAGIVLFENTSHWLVGGDTDKQSNIIIGPRCVLTFYGCHDCQIRGNYIHHDYAGGWSQGFALMCQNCQNMLAEHNVIRDSSWPLQEFAGEFRYNMIVNSGHNWVRVLTSGTQFHHNLIIHMSGGGDVNAGLWLYKDHNGGGRTDVAIYNNTFDAGAPAFKGFKGKPMIGISEGCSLSTLRNNVFVGINKPDNGKALEIIARGSGMTAENGTDVRIKYADYNCFFNPIIPGTPAYATGIVGTKSAGVHDVGADPKFAQGIPADWPIDEGAVWNQKFKVSQVLALFRERYKPAAGSPLIGAGDPADGAGSFIGAIAPDGTNSPTDLFGKFKE